MLDGSDFILRENRTCWRIEHATRCAVLTNERYFRALASSLKAAQKSILLAGWDFESRLVLNPRARDIRRLNIVKFLGGLLALRPELEIRLLLWDRTIFYGGNHGTARRLRRLQRQNPRFQFRFVSLPIGSSYHEKLVTIDDQIAFAGGIDLAGNRWDVNDHPSHLDQRVTPDGESYGPIHDLQFLVEGDAAQAVADVLRRQWTRITGQPIDPPIGVAGSPWPKDLAPNFADLDIGIARTDPFHETKPVREVECLIAEILRNARHSIYIESQYLTANLIGDLLAERLKERNCPEILAIVNESWGGFIEGFAMGSNCRRLVSRLRAVDFGGKFRVYYPVAGGALDGTPIKVHAKLIIADDRIMRIGSANLNNRSMGADTECDLVVAASDRESRASILSVRNELLAQHLHRPVDVVEQVLRETNSLLDTIDALNGEGYLRSLVPASLNQPQKPVIGTALMDPDEPISLAYLKRAFRGMFQPAPRGLALPVRR